jgi:hypothetical protein
MKNSLFALFILATLSLTPNPVLSQAPSGKSPRQNSTIEAMALYPAATRNAILTAVQYPQTLRQIAELQKKSSAGFQQLLAPLPKKTQEEVWELVKYPKLVEDMALGETGNLKNYTKDVQSSAQAIFKQQPQLLAEIAKLDDQPNREFMALIQKLPANAQAAFQSLLQNSDVLLALQEYLKQGSIPQLTAKLQAANNSASPQLGAAAGDDPKALAALQNQKDQIDRELNKQIDQDPYPPGARTMTVNYDPYPFVTGVPGFYTYPYWFGWPGWYW